MFGMGDHSVPVQKGIVGWASKAEHFDLGTAENDGTTLVHVQLFEKRTRRKTRKDEDLTKATGREILCQVGGPFYVIPPKGTVVLVAFPDGDYDSPGAGVILMWLNASPPIQFSDKRAVLGIPDTMDLVIKGKSITLSDYTTPAARWLTVGPSPNGGPAGILFCDEKGGMLTIQGGVVGLVAGDGSSPPNGTTVLQLTKDEATLVQKDGSMLKLKGGKATLAGQSCYVQGGAVYLGKAPVLANTALWGVTGVAGAPSPSVFISAV